MHLDCFHLAARDILIVNTRPTLFAEKLLFSGATLTGSAGGSPAMNATAFTSSKRHHGFAALFAEKLRFSGAVLNNCPEAAPPRLSRNPVDAYKNKNTTVLPIAFYKH
jgi:hypothetical protein